MRYNVGFQNIQMQGNAADILTFVSGTKRTMYVCEIDIEGMELAGAPLDLGLFLCSNPGSTGSVALTPSPVGNPNLTGSTPAIAFSGSVFTAWVGQPTLAQPAYFPFSMNANGQRYYWATENVDDMPSIPGGGGAAGTLSLRAINGGSHISGRIKIIE